MRACIDLRSDTVTRPTPAMRRAMAEAEVGDDVLGDDPTVLCLQARAAEIVGKESALFVPSGTMGNNIAIKVHTQPGDEILLDWDAHTMCSEVGGAAALSGVQTRPFRSHRGVPDVHGIESAIRTRSLHSPGSTLVLLENTHNRQGGAIIPLEVMRYVYALAKSKGLAVHLDGARLFNAAVASGLPAADFVAQADSVSFCLSKGLGCPVGSMLCGTREFIYAARRVRKMFGGGMRQAGVLAACGIVALDTMIDRLADDHAAARQLVDGLEGLPGIRVDREAVQTNMVYVDTDAPAGEIVGDLAAHNVRCLAMASHSIRLVTHYNVDEEDIQATILAFRRITGMNTGESRLTTDARSRHNSAGS